MLKCSIAWIPWKQQYQNPSELIHCRCRHHASGPGKSVGFYKHFTGFSSLWIDSFTGDVLERKCSWMMTESIGDERLGIAAIQMLEKTEHEKVDVQHTDKLEGEEIHSYRNWSDNADGYEQHIYDESIVNKLPHSNNLKLASEATLLFLESIGADYMKVIQKYPSVIDYSVQDLRLVLDFLEKRGLRCRDLGRLVNMCPQILGCNIELQLMPVMDFLSQDVGLNRELLCKTINRCPRLLLCSVEKQLRRALKYLQHVGYKDIKRVIVNNSGILTFSVTKKLIPRIRFLQNLGLSYQETRILIVRVPGIFNYSLDNLQKKYDYLTTVMGKDLCDLKSFPNYFTCSLEQKIIPRHELLFQRQLQVPFGSMLMMNDKDFNALLKRARKRSIPLQYHGSKIHQSVLFMNMHRVLT